MDRILNFISFYSFIETLTPMPWKKVKVKSLSCV